MKKKKYKDQFVVVTTDVTVEVPICARVHVTVRLKGKPPTNEQIQRAIKKSLAGKETPKNIEVETAEVYDITDVAGYSDTNDLDTAVQETLDWGQARASNIKVGRRNNYHERDSTKEDDVDD